MGRGKRAHGTYGEGGTRKAENMWNVNKKYRKVNIRNTCGCRDTHSQILYRTKLSNRYVMDCEM